MLFDDGDWFLELGERCLSPLIVVWVLSSIVARPRTLPSVGTPLWAVGLPGQRHPKRRIFRSSPLREEGGVLADCVDSESMKGIAALGNHRVLAAQLRSRDNAVVGASLLIKR